MSSFIDYGGRKISQESLVFIVSFVLAKNTNRETIEIEFEVFQQSCISHSKNKQMTSVYEQL
jgi:hypothetical protein